MRTEPGYSQRTQHVNLSNGAAQPVVGIAAAPQPQPEGEQLTTQPVGQKRNLQKEENPNRYMGPNGGENGDNVWCKH
jgi:hypothetical protein